MPIDIFPDAGGSSGGTVTTTTTTKTGDSKGSGGGGVDPYTAALRAQKAAENKARRKAARRYIRDAQVLGQQAEALKKAMSSVGFRQALATGLANIGRTQAQSDALLLEGYQDRLGSLESSAGDNEKAAAGQTVAALANRGRERANAISEAMSQGAGESDTLRAQQMSLRNWNANQSEVNRNFFDSQTSINSALHDLNADTKTARVNNALQAEADRGQLYATYYDQMSQTSTQLGNVLGQQAADYAAALEQVSNRKTRRRLRRARRRSEAAFDKASSLAGQAYSSPGASAALMAWEGQDDFESYVNPGVVLNAESSSVSDLGRPEGASLRKWEP